MVEKKINPFTEQLEGESGKLYTHSVVTVEDSVPTHDTTEFHQITIQQLFIITFACAGTIALIAQFHIGGTLALFGISAIASGTVVSRMQDRTTAYFIHEVLWGVLMPIACIITDPIIFIDQFGAFSWDFWTLPPPVAFGYSFFIWQIANLIASWFLAGKNAIIRSWFSATFMMGTMVAFAVGVCLLPFSLIGLLLILGVLGFTPFVTGWVYFSACRRYWPRIPTDSSESEWRNWSFFAAGFLVSLLVPIGVLFVRVNFAGTWQ